LIWLAQQVPGDRLDQVGEVDSAVRNHALGSVNRDPHERRMADEEHFGQRRRRPCELIGHARPSVFAMRK
jgi:hypothetical protein